MAETSKIEWTDATVNFWWGCTKVGPGCDHCYAESLSRRYGHENWGVGVPRRKIKSAVKLMQRLDQCWVFVQSMSDIFDLEAPLEWFAEAWETIEDNRQLRLQIVTKRISVVQRRLAEIKRSTWPRHAGLIITVVNQAEADRDIPRLIAVKRILQIPWVGLSIEPMLGPMNIAPWLSDIDWVIVGGESGPHARDNDFLTNARSILAQCRATGVPFFGKQNVKKAPLPDDLMIREFPVAAQRG